MSALKSLLVKEQETLEVVGESPLPAQKPEPLAHAPPETLELIAEPA